VVDSRPFGGTCALRGCVPKKILVSAAEAVHGARDMAGKGVPGGSLTIEEDTGRILGAHLLGPHAEEVINPALTYHSAGHPGGRAEAGALRLPDRLGHPLHAL